MTFRPVAPRWVAAALRLLIAVQVVGVLFVADRHKPWFAFEESNTLRFASLPPADMADVLDEDQNFPVYYKVLHRLEQAFGPSGRPAIAFNCLTWLLSLVVFHLLAREVIGPGAWALLATLAFTATASIHKYAYFVRMYAQSNLLLLITLLGLARYANRGARSWLWPAGLALIAGSLFHPAGGPCAILFFLAAFPVARGIKDRLIVTAFAGSAAFLALFEGLIKNDFKRLYLGTGTQYVRQISTPFHAFMGMLLGRTQGTYSWIYFVLGAVLLYFFFTRAPILRRVIFPLTVFNAIFVLLHFVLPSVANAHHYYYFTATLVLAMVLGLMEATRGGTRCTWLAVALPIVFLWGGSTHCLEEHRNTPKHEKLEEALRKLPEGAIVSDFIIYDVVDRAVGQDPRRKFILCRDGLVETTSLSLKEVLTLQAKLGGLPGSGVGTGAYRSALAKQLEGKDSPLRRQVAQLAASTPSIYFVLPLNRESLFAEELDVFEAAPYRELLRPTIYRFSAKER